MPLIVPVVPVVHAASAVAVAVHRDQARLLAISVLQGKLLTMWAGNRERHLEIISIMQVAFRRLEQLVPPPRGVPVAGEELPRYTEQLPEQALVIKLARIVSGLRAIDMLVLLGCFQEQATLQRVLDDAGEDIMFIGFALTNGLWSADHDQYMGEFWVDAVGPDGRSIIQKVGMLPRKKIRAFVARCTAQANPDSQYQNGRILYQTYSNFVHASAMSAMDMVRGTPPRFVIDGNHSNERRFEYARDAGNYFYRGIMAAFVVAKALGDEALASDLRDTMDSLGPA